MATKKKAAKKAVKAAVKKAKPVPAPPKAAKPATKAASENKKNKVDDFSAIQATVNDSVGKPISNEELNKAIGVIEGSTGKSGASAEVRTQLYDLLKEWGYYIKP